MTMKKKAKIKNPVCMICGKKMKSLFDNTYANVNGGLTLEINMTYGSALDGNVYGAALCDECVGKAAKEKKIVLKKNVLLG